MYINQDTKEPTFQNIYYLYLAFNIAIIFPVYVHNTRENYKVQTG